MLKKFFEIFSLRGLKNEPSRCLPIEGQNEFPREPWKPNTHSTGTFLIGGESPSRMKVRHELPAHKGYYGKRENEIVGDEPPEKKPRDLER